jgi:hypothetical protein
MQKLFGTALVAVGLVAAPSIARAQMAGMPHHEFGVDVGIGYAKPSGGTGTFAIATPVDVRVGFVSSGSMMVEPRFTLNFISGGGTFIAFDPGVNVLFKLGQGTGMHNLMGPYFTVGADANIVSSKPSGGTSTSGAIIGVNGGIGTRMPYGSGATRLEAFVGYKLKNTSLLSPNTFVIGARIGLSLWH